MPLKAVTFDLWLTLIWDSKELEEYRRLRRLVNFHRLISRVRGDHENEMVVAEKKFRQADVRLALETLQEKVKSLYERGYDVHPRDRGRMLFELLGISFPAELKEKIYERAGNTLSNSGYFSRYPNLNPQAAPTLKLLKKAFPDLKIALVSNAARSARAYARILRALGIGGYFDHLVISCEVGYLKPRKEIFKRALSLLDVKPSEALHVGDLFRADVIGAVESRMNACLYTGLWHRYAQYMNPGEHIPREYVSKHPNLVIREIDKLQDVVRIAKSIP
jgi:HAD superfamily hydrolase (TIGR01549 family)